MTDNRSDVHASIEQDGLRDRFEHEFRPVAEQVITDAVRPWRRAVFWLALGYGLLLVASVVQALLSYAR